MDTSNSFPPEVVLKHIWKGPKYFTDGLSPEQWVELLNLAIAELKPQLKYMNGFTPLSRLSCERGAVVEESFRLARVQHSVWPGLRVRYMTETYFSARETDRRSAWYLTDRGLWIEAPWTETWDGTRSTRVAQTARFISDEMLTEFLADRVLGQNGRMGHNLLESLHSMVEKTISEREKKQGELRVLETKLTGVLSRMQYT